MADDKKKTPSLPEGNEGKDAAVTSSICEGSITMTYPADEESTVFYNPVQVQNRDLSILMISLYSERRAVAKAVAAKRKALRKLNHDRPAQDRWSNEQVQEQLQQYQQSLMPNQLAVDHAREQGICILDALAASGLRSMRYWKEIPGVKHITINDLELAAVERAKTNLSNNNLMNVVLSDGDDGNKKIDELGNSQRPYGIRVQHGDAKIVMYQSQRPQGQEGTTDLQKQLQPQWDVIDLDPYGSAAPFLDAAVQAIESGGLLCVTCTDMAALGGSHPETCYGRYASMPIPKAGYLQELALRILLFNMATTAAKYGRTIRPVLSVGMNFYIRVFVEVVDDKSGVSKLSLNIGTLYQSTQCPSFHIVPHGRLAGKKNTNYQPNRAPAVPRCEETDAEFKVAGPLWLGPLHDMEVVQTALERLNQKQSASSNCTTYPNLDLIATRTRLQGLLMNVRDELNNVPLHYNLPDLTKALRMGAPPINKIKAALINAGYRVSGYHKEPQALKTDAPNRVMWDVLRVWCRNNPPKKAPEEGSAAAKILAVDPLTKDFDFTIPKALKVQLAAGSEGGKKISRFPMNPEANWGPKKAASGYKRKVDET